jgi:hypothetical protein
MEFKTFITEYQIFSEEGSEFGAQIVRAIAPIIEEWADKGYPYHELEHTINSYLSTYMAGRRIRFSSKKHKAERETPAKDYKGE